MGKIINCHTCKQEIAAEAKVCPHCGAKNKKGGGCCSGVLLIVLFLVIIAAIAANKTAKSIPEKNAESSSSAISEEIFAEIKKDPSVEKVEITGSKIKVIYKKDLPEMCFLEMRKLAQRGAKHTGKPYSAECSVTSAPDKILYFETRNGNQTTAISFARNTHAINKKLEEERLTEAKRQQKIIREQIKKSIACDKFERQFVSKWDGSCRPVVEAIKEKMNDAKSFEHIKTKVFITDTENFQVEMKFRGKNAYGGMVINIVTATVTPDGKVIAVK